MSATKKIPAPPATHHFHPKNHFLHFAYNNIIIPPLNDY